MPNVIKYSTGTTPSTCLRKGNMLIGNNTGDYGGTFYNGIDPPSGGYTIYLNKATGGPSIYRPTNNTQLINITNQIAGTNYATVDECLNYFASQTDKIITNMTYPTIVTDGLVMAFDDAYTVSYPQNGVTMYDIKGNNSYVPYSSVGNPSWANNISAFTCCLLLTKTATGTGYANHPVQKWNSGYNVNASFILYHFENYQGNNQDGVLGWYGNGANSGWANIGTYGFTRMSVGQTKWVALQYNSTQGGQAWVNGSQSGGRSGNNGLLGSTFTTTYDFQFYAPIQIGTGYVRHILFYDRELTNEEMTQNYNAVSSRVVN
jgi:hypothetical protein